VKNVHTIQTSHYLIHHLNATILYISNVYGMGAACLFLHCQ